MVVILNVMSMSVITYIYPILVAVICEYGYSLITGH